MANLKIISAPVVEQEKMFSAVNFKPKPAGAGILVFLRQMPIQQFLLLNLFIKQKDIANNRRKPPL